MCFNKKGDFSTLNGITLKLVDKFMYHSSSILSTESDINMCPPKPLTAIDGLSIISKSNLSDKIKQFLPSSGGVNSTVWMDADETYQEKASW